MGTHSSDLDSNRLRTAAEVATDPTSPLAGKLNRATVYRLIRNGNMPGVVRVGRRVYVTAAGLREWIAAGGTAQIGGAK
jgi:predicted DNA-binding transcriptional regulator AlpA